MCRRFDAHFTNGSSSTVANFNSHTIDTPTRREKGREARLLHHPLFLYPRAEGRGGTEAPLNLPRLELI